MAGRVRRHGLLCDDRQFPGGDVRRSSLAARKSFIELDGVIQPAPALRFSRSAPGTPRAPSAQNTADEALADWVDPETFQSFEGNGA